MYYISKYIHSANIFKNLWDVGPIKLWQTRQLRKNAQQSKNLTSKISYKIIVNTYTYYISKYIHSLHIFKNFRNVGSIKL